MDKRWINRDLEDEIMVTSFEDSIASKWFSKLGGKCPRAGECKIEFGFYSSMGSWEAYQFFIEIRYVTRCARLKFSFGYVQPQKQVMWPCSTLETSRCLGYFVVNGTSLAIALSLSITTCYSGFRGFLQIPTQAAKSIIVHFVIEFNVMMSIIKWLLVLVVRMGRAIVLKVLKYSSSSSGLIESSRGHQFQWQYGCSFCHLESGLGFTSKVTDFPQLDPTNSSLFIPFFEKAVLGPFLGPPEVKIAYSSVPSQFCTPCLAWQEQIVLPMPL